MRSMLTPTTDDVIRSALKAQLYRLKQDRVNTKDIPLLFVMAMNKNIAELERLLANPKPFVHQELHSVPRL